MPVETNVGELATHERPPLAPTTAGASETPTRAETLDANVIAELRAIVGDDGVISSYEQRRAYESDGLASFRVTPALVVLPTTTAQDSGSICPYSAKRISSTP